MRKNKHRISTEFRKKRKQELDEQTSKGNWSGLSKLGKKTGVN